ncbi:MAG: response regulator [Candidatus Marinimicrobia bacterium]|nr:response regulator [Candidatus Neomarinimicrobiota bacterium]
MSENKKNINVLIVDDDIDFLNQTKIRLEAAGYHVQSAESQKAAEELLKTFTPDIALLDLMMENMDGGFALAYHIKKKNSKIPVIIASGVTSETGIEFDAKTEEEKSWIKADAFLTKPIRFEQLEKQMTILLKK